MAEAIRRPRSRLNPEMGARDHQLLLLLPVAVYVTDVVGRVVFFNEAAASLWGRRPELGKEFWCGSWRLFRPDGTPIPLDECPMAVTLKKGLPQPAEEVIIERPDGTRRNILPNPQPIRNESGAVIGALNMLVDVTDQRTSDAVAARLGAIVESSDDAIISKDLTGRIHTWNDAAERIFGYAAAEAIGQFITLLIPPELLNEEGEILGRIRAGQRVDHFLTRRRHKDGHLVDISLTVSPIRDSTGKIIGASKIARDITGQKQADDALVRSERNLSDFFENASIGLHWVGPDGIILRANRAELEMLGYERHEYVGRSIREFHVDHEVIDDMLSRLVSGEELSDYRSRMRCRDGSIRHVLMNANALWENDRFVHSRCFTRDVTIQVLAEQAQRVSEERILQLISLMPAAVYTCDATGRISFFNRRAAEVWGREPAVLDESDRYCGSLRLLDAKGFPMPHEQSPMARAVNQGVGVRDVEMTIERPDGTQVIVSGNVEPLIDAEGRRTGAIGVLQDVTERKQAEAELAVALDDLDVQVAGLTRLHELATQLAVTHDLNATLDAILQAVVEIHGTDRGLLSLYDPETDRLKVCADLRFSADSLKLMSSVVAAPFAESCGSSESRRRVVVEDTETDPCFSDYRDVARRVGFRAVHSTPIVNRSGDMLGLLSVYFDIPRRPSAREMQLSDMCAKTAADVIEAARTREALRESEQRFRNMADTAPAMLWITSPSGSCSFLSHGWYAFTGQSPDTGLGFGWIRAVHPEDRQAAREVFLNTTSGREPFSLDYRVRRADGEYRWVIGAGRPRFGENGEFLGYIGSVIDITERKEAEETVRQSEDRFRNLADNMSQFAWMADSNGWVFWYNRRWFEYTGTTLEDMEGWGWTKVHHPDHLDRVVAKIQHCWDTGELWEDTFPIRGKDGEYRWFLSRAAPIRDDSGRIIRWIGTNTDITSQREAEAELKSAKETAEAANLSKDRFLAILSHELRTPLSPVLLCSASMANNPKLPEEIRRDASMIRDSVRLETKLIDDLLDLSRITTGKLRLRLEAVDLNDAVLHVCSICRPQIQEKGIHLHCHFDENVSHVSGDPARLQQVLWNILNNAAKFTPEGGDIFVTTERQANGRLRVQVRDTGAGIAADALPRIFDAFEQGDSRVSRQFGGLGLGLAISRALVEFHNGRIRAESPGKGQGATFTVEIPEVTVDVGAPVEPPNRNNGHSRQMRILVVEDHPDTARLVTRMLEDNGYAVQTANCVAAALEMASHEAFDILVSDVGLPDASGFDLMRQMRDRYGVPGIAVSGYGMDDDIRRGREAGFSEHLVKPIEPDHLEQAIQRVLASAAADHPA